MTKALRVGVVVSSTEHGGAEAQIGRLWTNPLVAARAHAHLLGDLPQWGATGLPATDIGLGAKWSYRRTASSLLSMPVVAARGQRAIRDVAAREGFDAFYAHFKREQILYTSAMSKRAPVIWMEHGALPGGRLKRPLLAAYRRAAHRAAAVICLSEQVKSEIEAVVGSDGPELAVIGNSIDPDWTSPASDAERTAARIGLGVPDDAGLVVAVVARLIPRKRIEQAIRAVARLPSCWLIICGDGPLGPQLRAQAADNPRVIFTGFLKDPRPVYAASDVSLLASWEEGFGHVLLEAACAGLPSVVVADAGISSTVAGWGVVADEPTGESIAEAITEASRLPSENARRWAEERGPDAWARAHLDVLERAVRRSR